jgi:hypothetical protein
MTTSTDLIVPVTGEVVSLDSPTDTLCEAWTQVRRLERDLADARGTLNNELTKRMDHENLRKVAVGDWQVEVGPPGTVEWDADKVHDTLLAIATEGSISPTAAERVTTITRKVSLRELKKVLTVLSPEDAARVNGCATPSARARRVTVKHRDEFTR